MEEVYWSKHWLNFTEWAMQEGSSKKQEYDISLAPRKLLTWVDGRKKLQNSLFVGNIRDTYSWINQ